MDKKSLSIKKICWVIFLSAWFMGIPIGYAMPNFQIIEPGRTGVDTVYLTGLRALVDF